MVLPPFSNSNYKSFEIMVYCDFEWKKFYFNKVLDFVVPIVLKWVLSLVLWIKTICFLAAWMIKTISFTSFFAASITCLFHLIKFSAMNSFFPYRLEGFPDIRTDRISIVKKMSQFRVLDSSIKRFLRRYKN